MPNKQEQYTKLAITKFTNTNVLSKPDLKSIGNKVLNAYASTLGLQLTDDTDYNYWTTPPSEMNRIKYFKYSDFRTRRAFLQRRQDGANAALNGVISALNEKGSAGDRLKKSFKAAKYYASSFIPGGTYTIINLSSPSTLGFGWGIHTTPSLIKDFTLQTAVTTKWSHTAGTWKPKLIAQAFPFRGDKVNVTDSEKRHLNEVYRWKPKLFKSKDNPGAIAKALGKVLNAIKLNQTQDFIKFYFTGPKLYNGNDNSIDDIMAFRATITSLEDSFSAGWEEARMVGRADPNYLYTGFSRSLQLGFMVYATDRDELKPIWRKLNTLAGYTAPKYGGDSTIAPIAPWLRMTIGDLFVQQPVLIDSLSYTLHDSDTQWEINIEDDPEMKQAPIKISVSMGLKVITDYLPETNGQFYTLADRNDEWGALPGTDSWLSDSVANERLYQQGLRKKPLGKAVKDGFKSLFNKK